jgi:hypothetical protein
MYSQEMQTSAIPGRFSGGRDTMLKKNSNPLKLEPETTSTRND